MSPTPDPHTTADPGAPQAERAEHAAPDTDARETEVAEAERSRLATDPDPTLTSEHAPRGHTSVEWATAPDLATRGASRTLGYGAELPQRLQSAVQEMAQEHRGRLQERLADRAAEVEPAATSARSRTQAPEREGVGR
ncbi:hypothetical protein KACC15558_26210 [Brevibacterium ammoniilyticum]|uniref:Uncharacterized protein n=2 Tax=Brevibacterium TaxID=1696 RepID=A0ABP9U1S7_9MICO